MHPLVVGAIEIVEIDQGRVAAAEYGGVAGLAVMMLANLRSAKTRNRIPSAS